MLLLSLVKRMTCAQISAFLFGTRLVSRNHDILYLSCCNVIPLVTRIISERHLVYYGREVMFIVLNSKERTIRPRLYAQQVLAKRISRAPGISLVVITRFSCTCYVIIITSSARRNEYLIFALTESRSPQV